ncbi:unnamed protein product, partial [Rotaria magnacalcarata]
MKWTKGSSHGILVAGGEGPGLESRQLFNPVDITVDKKAPVFITDGGNYSHRVTRWSNGSKLCEILASSSSYSITGITLDNKEEYLYVIYYWEHKIVKLGKAGKSAPVVIPTQGLSYQNAFYVSNKYSERVLTWVVNESEPIVMAGGNRLWNETESLSDPAGIVVDQSGAIYVTNAWGNRIIRIPPTGEKGYSIFDNVGSSSNSGNIRKPYGLAMDRHGN